MVNFDYDLGHGQSRALANPSG